MEYFNTFYGNKISDYGMTHGYVDYATLANCGNHILCNDIWQMVGITIIPIQEPEEVDGFLPEIFQTYIVSETLAEIIREYTSEYLFYIEELNLYLWGITHYGTSWTHVLTEIPLTRKEYR